MPIMVEREKWILYKHTCDYDLIKAVALDVKNSCASDVSQKERYLMQERLAALDLYRTRNPKEKPLDSINHRINTLEYFMFGYEEPGSKRFIFSPLGNLFLSKINEEEKLKKIIAAMLFGIQFEHPANGTPASFQLFPFRLIFKLMTDDRLERKLYSTEYAYIVAFVHTINETTYETLVNDILSFRKLSNEEKIRLLKEDEHTYVNCIYEWQYYMQKLFSSIGILAVYDGETIGKLYHPTKPNSSSSPTGRSVKSGYSKISASIYDFVVKMLENYSIYERPLRLDDPNRMRLDVVKEIYSFYPKLLLEEIGEAVDEVQMQLLTLSKNIELYANNPDNSTCYLFEDALTEGMNMFINVNANKVGGAGHTDIECLYITRRSKFAVEAKSTANRLMEINANRLKDHRQQIGGEYTIVVTSNYVPAAKRDIRGEPIVIVLASTFSEYLYNHIFHDRRDIDFKDFDDIIVGNLGKDISPLISNLTMEKFATRNT